MKVSEVTRLQVRLSAPTICPPPVKNHRQNIKHRSESI